MEVISKMKWFVQRGRRGWADCDTWGFDDYISGVIVGGLEYLREHTHGYPANLKSADEWDKILEKMIIGFKAAQKLKNNGYMYFKPTGKGLSKLEVNEDLMNDLLKKQNEALDLFKEYFGNLWD